MVRLVSLSVLLTLIVVLGVTFYKVVAPFILPLFLAAVFAILCQPIYAYFLARTKQRIRLAAGLTTGAIVSAILIPLVIGTILASLQLFVVATNLSNRNIGRILRERTDPILQYVAEFLNKGTALPNASMKSVRGENDNASEPESNRDDAGMAPDSESAEAPAADAAADADSLPPVDDSAGAAITEADSITDSADRSANQARGPPVNEWTAAGIRTRFQTWVRDWLSEIGSKSLGTAGGTLAGSVVAIGSAVLAFAIFAIALYYFLVDGSQLIRATERLIPVHVEYQRQVLTQFSKVVRAVVVATFLAALAQAIATVAALWVLGFDHLFVLFVVSVLTAMVPMMGTWVVWLPCAGYLLYNGHWVQALLLAVYGSAFVALVDNVVRTYVLNTDVKLHPLLALISVLGGLQVMGLWGLFVGPIVASCLHALVKIFNHELAELSKEKFAPLEGMDKVRPDGESAPPVIPTPPVPTVAKRSSSGQNGDSETDQNESPSADS